MSNRFVAVGAITVAVALSACVSTRGSSGQSANLSDARMRCAQSELFRKGYNVSKSSRRPGELLATREFSSAAPYRAAISAELDSTDNTLEMWTRVIRSDGTTVLAATTPSGRLMMDAMEVANICENAK